MKIFFKISLFVYFVLSSFLCYAQEGTIKWSVGTHDEVLAEFPALGLDGNIYFTDISQNFYAYHSNGTSYWSLLPGAQTVPVVGSDSSIYFGFTYNIFSYYPNGTLQWSTTAYSSEFNWSNAIGLGADNTVYVGGHDSTFRAFTPRGVQKWGIKLDQMNVSDPSVNRKYGTCYVIGYTYFTYPLSSTTFYAINPDSSIAWKISTSGVFSISAIDAQGLLYIPHSGGTLFCYYPNGILKWSSSISTTVLSPAVLGVDGTIYVGSHDHYLYAVNPNGTLKWKFQANNMIIGGATIGNDSVIYFGDYSGYLYALNPDSTLRWSFQASGLTPAIEACPVIDSSGTLYIGSGNSAFYAFYCSSTGLANSPWPRVLHDNQNTGLSSPIIAATPLFPDELFP